MGWSGGPFKAILMDYFLGFCICIIMGCYAGLFIAIIKGWYGGIYVATTQTLIEVSSHYYRRV
jgi:hypothetical protein